ncbi:hypothetical protein CM49_01054 [Paenibacillus sp. P1XP2]|nr:hypothetical protein CM49_01054 [Paenibacillus sp. P1XP2]
MKKWMTLGLTLLLVFALSACGSKTNNNTAGNNAGTAGGTTGGAAGGAQDIKVTATNFQFEPAEIRVKKGDKVKITLVNKEGAHGLEIPTLKSTCKRTAPPNLRPINRGNTNSTAP